MVQNRNPLTGNGGSGQAGGNPSQMETRERLGSQAGRTQSLGAPASTAGNGNAPRAGEPSARQSVQERMSRPTSTSSWNRSGQSAQAEQGRATSQSQPALNSGSTTNPASDARGQMQRDRSTSTRSSERFVSSPANDRSSWQRFSSQPGGGNQRPDSLVQQRSDSQTLSNRPSTMNSGNSSRSWDRYSRGAPSTSTSSSDSRTFSNRPSTMNSGSPRSWDRYGQSAPSVQRAPSVQGAPSVQNAPSMQSERSWRGGGGVPERGSWNAPLRSGSAPPMRDFSRGQSDPSPRSYQRPPLELSKPIVTQRAPQTFRSEPSRSGRSEGVSARQGGGNGGGGGRSGGGYSRGGGEGRGRR